MSFKKFMAAFGPDAAGSLEEVAVAFDTLTRGLTGFSDAANASSDNYTELLDGLTKIGSAFGELDKITSHQASKELSELANLVEWHTYSNSKHEIHHDKDAEKLFNDVLSFVQGH